MRWDGVIKERRDERRELAASWASFHQCINSPQPHPITHIQYQYLLPRETHSSVHILDSVSAISDDHIHISCHIQNM